MAEITLLAETGRPTGSRESGRLRAAGHIPGVIYGHGTAPIPVSVEGRELRAALTTEAGVNVGLDMLNVKGAYGHYSQNRFTSRDYFTVGASLNFGS